MKEFDYGTMASPKPDDGLTMEKILEAIRLIEPRTKEDNVKALVVVEYIPSGKVMKVEVEDGYYWLVNMLTLQSLRLESDNHNLERLDCCKLNNIWDSMFGIPVVDDSGVRFGEIMMEISDYLFRKNNYLGGLDF